MEPTLEEYPSKMRVALVRRNPADGAAPLGLKKSRPSKSLQPYPFTPLSHPPVSLRRTRPPGGRPRPPTARQPRLRLPALPAPPVTARLRPHAAAHARVGDRQDRTPAGPRGQGAGAAPRSPFPAAPHARRLRMEAGLVAAGRARPTGPLPPPVCNTRFIKGHKPSNHIRARIKSHVYTTE